MGRWPDRLRASDPGGVFIVMGGKVMSKISVEDARSFANVLVTGANNAVAKGETEFDLTEAVEEKYAEAKAAAQAAVDSSAPSGQ
jgi:hypothetical protein